MTVAYYLSEIELPLDLPPMVVFTCKRPHFVTQLIEAIRQQTLLPKQLIVFVDAAKIQADEAKVNACIALFKDIRDIPVSLVKREKNLGCGSNILQGVDDVLQRYSEAIFLEDDMIPSPHFYKTMCLLLENYRSDKEVFSITGSAVFAKSQYARDYKKGAEKILIQLKTDMFCANRFAINSWAVWADRWAKVKQSVSTYENPFKFWWRIPLLPLSYDLMIYFILHKMKKADAWDVPISLYVLYHKLKVITPRYAMMRNIGFGDPDSVHTRSKSPLFNTFYREDFVPDTLPKTLQLLPEFEKSFGVLLYIFFLLKLVQRKLVGLKTKTF